MVNEINTNPFRDLKMHYGGRAGGEDILGPEGRIYLPESIKTCWQTDWNQLMVENLLISNDVT